MSINFLNRFIYCYPILMGFIWMIGALIFFFRREWGEPGAESPPKLDTYPPVSILIPCHNEAETIRETIEALDKQSYPDYEVIAINDGSRDKTEEILDELVTIYPWLRVVHIEDNRGKATALNIGVLLSRGEFIVCIDADAIPDPFVVTWMMYHFVKWPRVGGVTGNPRIRNRASLLSKIQVGEFSAIIGMIKRCQRVIGKIFTVSGVVSGFRKSALTRVGLWDTDMVTEDIDITWKLQTDFWDIRFEPRAICRILMPETIMGLWRQRLRWAQGGMEVIIKNLWIWRSWKQRRLFIIYIDYLISVFWSYSVIFTAFTWIFGIFFKSPERYQLASLLPGWNGVVIGLACMLQFAIGMLLDNRYEKGIGKYYYWTIWYPLLYWILSILVVAVAVPKAIFKKKGRFATWESPDRGLEIYEKEKIGFMSSEHD
ncbi:MAG: poly-beta-1,6-N-acetyl-D-glucosamine synthase [Nitrospirota bacterium]